MLHSRADAEFPGTGPWPPAGLPQELPAPCPRGLRVVRKGKRVVAHSDTSFGGCRRAAGAHRTNGAMSGSALRTVAGRDCVRPWALGPRSAGCSTRRGRRDRPGQPSRPGVVRRAPPSSRPRSSRRAVDRGLGSPGRHGEAGPVRRWRFVPVRAPALVAWLAKAALRVRDGEPAGPFQALLGQPGLFPLRVSV